MFDFQAELGVRLPIWNAGMGLGIAGPALAAAVGEAGGFGVMGLGGLAPEQIRAQIHALRQNSDRPFGVNLIMPLLQGGEIEVCLEERVPVLILFWGDPAPYVTEARRRGVRLFVQCGNAEEAVRAAEAGVDGVLLQGIEAGGHVKAEKALADNLRDVAGELGGLTLVASGGVATGGDIAAALKAGAHAVSMGTRFLATNEASAQASYKQRIVRARASDTVFTKLFDVGWPDAAHRVIRNKAFDEWERAGTPASGQRPGEGRVVATMQAENEQVPLPRYTIVPPLNALQGDEDELPLYCGMSCDGVKRIATAGDVVAELERELRAASR